MYLKTSVLCLCVDDTDQNTSTRSLEVCSDVGICRGKCVENVCLSEFDFVFVTVNVSQCCQEQSCTSTNLSFFLWIPNNSHSNCFYKLSTASFYSLCRSVKISHNSSVCDRIQHINLLTQMSLIPKVIYRFMDKNTWHLNNRFICMLITCVWIK